MSSPHGGRTSPDERMTPGARQVFGELMQSAHQRLLEAADARALRYSGDIAEITVRDVLEGAGALGMFTPPDPQPASLSTVQRLARHALSPFTVGLFVAVLSATAAIFALTDITSGSYPFIVFTGIGTLTMVGLLVMYSRLAFRRRLEEEHRERDASVGYDLILAWVNVEIAIREAAAREFGESRANLPLGELIRRLAAKGLLTDDDIPAIERLRRIRNDLVHDKYSSQPYDESEQFATARRLYRKLAAAKP